MNKLLGLLLILAIILALSGCCPYVLASEIPIQEAVHAILGEARGEDLAVQYAIACAIRNRGTLDGVFGATADVSDAGNREEFRAIQAWAQSASGPDVTNGATDFMTLDDMIKLGPAQMDKFLEQYIYKKQIGPFYFYKRRKQ